MSAPASTKFHARFAVALAAAMRQESAASATHPFRGRIGADALGSTEPDVAVVGCGSVYSKSGSTLSPLSRSGAESTEPRPPDSASKGVGASPATT